MRIRLYVDGKPYIIEQCEGSAEIRAASSPKVDAGRSCTAYISGGYDEGGLSFVSGRPTRAVELKVENAE